MFYLLSTYVCTNLAITVASQAHEYPRHTTFIVTIGLATHRICDQDEGGGGRSLSGREGRSGT